MSSLQRILHDGVPVWKDAAGVIYYYESSAQPAEGHRIRLGTISGGLDADWETRLVPVLAAYREEIKAGPRATAAAKK
jgi:hypothetical protein